MCLMQLSEIDTTTRATISAAAASYDETLHQQQQRRRQRFMQTQIIAMFTFQQTTSR